MMPILDQVERERQKNTVYPPQHLIFNAFKHVPLEEVKVVIVGQDPYHGEGQAMGLSFSVPIGIKVPPSLKNIYKEIPNGKGGVGIECGHGDLSSWAQQGVFMLNALLTVRAKQPMSHKPLGWEDFTDEVIQCINDKCKGVIFLLWGQPAQKKAKSVNRTKHHVLECGHPSPLSAYREGAKGFYGHRQFDAANKILKKQGKKQIDWIPRTDGRYAKK